MLKSCEEFGNEYVATLQHAASKTTRLVGRGLGYGVDAWACCIGRPVNRVLGLCFTSHRNPNQSLHAYYTQGSFERAALDLEAQPLEPNCQVATDVPCCTATVVTASSYGACIVLLAVPTLGYLGLRSAIDSCCPGTFTRWRKGKLPPGTDAISDEHLRRIAHAELYCEQLKRLYENVSANGLLQLAYQNLQAEIAQHDPVALSYVIWSNLDSLVDELELDGEPTKAIPDNNNDGRVRAVFLLRALRDYQPTNAEQHHPTMKAVAKLCSEFLDTNKQALAPIIHVGLVGEFLTPLRSPGAPLPSGETSKASTHLSPTMPFTV